MYYDNHPFTCAKELDSKSLIFSSNLGVVLQFKNYFKQILVILYVFFE
jgi:hypothetical protein